jgi:hypothetical protein
LSNAVSHLYEGRHRECINRAFAIIEKDTSIKDYYKYNCIRNILTHDKLNQNVIDDFRKYLGPINKIINLDFESKKTRNTLDYVARDLINECKKIPGM